MAVQAGLCLAWSETLEDTFCRVVAQILNYCHNQNIYCDTQKQSLARKYEYNNVWLSLEQTRNIILCMDRVEPVWYLSPMRAVKVVASLRIRAVSPEPPLHTHTSSESRGTFRQKARPLAPLNGWACAFKICHDGILEDTNLLDGARIV